MNELDQERTHVILQMLQGGAGHIRLLVTITGTVGPDSVADLATYRPNPADRTAINRRYVSSVWFYDIYGVKVIYQN